MDFRVLGSRRLGRGVFLALDEVHLIGPGGSVSRRDVVRHPGGVGVLPVGDDEVWLIRQYRVAMGRPVLEIPAGKLDRRGEPVETAARRELEEELGFEAGEVIPLGRLLPSPGYTDEVIHLYAATGIVGIERRPEGAEEHEAEIVRMPLAEAYGRLDSGEIDDAKTQIALMAWARRQR